MRVLIVLVAALACVLAKPAAVSYAYSAIAPWTHGYGYPYAAAYNPLAYSAVVPSVAAAPALAYSAPALAYSAPALAYSAPAPVSPIVADSGIKSQYHAQDELGQASYGHAEPGQVHNAVQDAAGNKVGSFSFVNPEGKLVHTSYVADAAGYRVASNDLPVAPVHAAVGPAPVADTPEVVAAKIAHLAEVEAAKSRSKRDIALTPAATVPITHGYASPLVHPYASPLVYPYASPLVRPYSAYPYSTLGYAHAYPTTHTVPVVTGPHGYLADTPEVAAAKADHFAEVAAAKARVAAPWIL